MAAQQGKWGWYPCDMATYQKLKAINLAYDKALHQMKAWQRWERKDPKNRVSRKKLKDSNGQVVGYGIAEPLPEPEICPIFTSKVVKKCVWDRANNYHKDGIDRTFVKMTQDSVYDDYRKARYPVPSWAEVQPLSMDLDKIDKIYLSIKDR